uniref:Uncharacterized protein n=1 Tax=Staphylococcus epidermidis TaxID=1282 RepID=D2JD14_STAEP|nr:hypothetical protein SAP025A_008 [Staphylococcus epidermidis]
MFFPSKNIKLTAYPKIKNKIKKAMRTRSKNIFFVLFVLQSGTLLINNPIINKISLAKYMCFKKRKIG